MKKFIVILTALILLTSLSLSAFANREKPPRLIDNAELLTADEFQELSALLDEKSEQYSFDIIILTVDSIGSKIPFGYATDFYEENGYGFGEDFTGAILLISMEKSDWELATCGEGQDIIPDTESIDTSFVSMLGDKDYYSAFKEFVATVEYEIDDYRTFDWGLNIIIALAVGLIIALIATSSMKSKLKSVNFQNNAREYVREGSLNVQTSRDLYLYSTITRTAKPKNTSSGGRTSSSGRSYGGGGGKF